jgi:HSP20 family protein
VARPLPLACGCHYTYCVCQYDLLIMSKPRRPALDPNQTRHIEAAVAAEKYLDRLAVGSWTPNVDICETADRVFVRVEVPSVEKSDISLTIQDGILRVQGIKREAMASGKLLCYYCLERRYGKFDRSIPIHWVVDAQKACALLEKGVLTIELPKLEDRRGQAVQIPISRKQG